MIDALIAGKLFSTPAQHTAKNGNYFATAKVKVATCDGQSLIANVIAFDADTCTALLELDEGDSVALSGTLTPKAWTDREGNARPSIDLVAHQVITPYHVTRKRRAMEGSYHASPHQQAADPAREPLDF